MCTFLGNKSTWSFSLSSLAWNKAFFWTARSNSALVISLGLALSPCPKTTSNFLAGAVAAGGGGGGGGACCWTKFCCIFIMSQSWTGALLLRQNYENRKLTNLNNFKLWLNVWKHNSKTIRANDIDTTFAILFEPRMTLIACVVGYPFGLIPPALACAAICIIAICCWRLLSDAEQSKFRKRGLKHVSIQNVTSPHRFNPSNLFFFRFWKNRKNVWSWFFFW